MFGGRYAVQDNDSLPDTNVAQLHRAVVLLLR